MSCPDQQVLIDIVTQLLDTVQQQLQQTDLSNQAALSQSTVAQLDRQRLDHITQTLNAVKSGVSSGNLDTDTAIAYQIQFQTIEDELRLQIRDTDNQVTQSLQQAVASLAQAQSAMMDSQVYTDMEKQLHDLRQELTVLS